MATAIETLMQSLDLVASETRLSPVQRFTTRIQNGSYLWASSDEKGKLGALEVEVAEALLAHGRPFTRKPELPGDRAVNTHQNIDLHYKLHDFRLGNWYFNALAKNDDLNDPRHFIHYSYRPAANFTDNPEQFRFAMFNGYVPEELAPAEFAKWGKYFPVFRVFGTEYSTLDEDSADYHSVRSLDFTHYLAGTFQFHIQYAELDRLSGRPHFGTPYSPLQGKPLGQMNQQEFRLVQELMAAYKESAGFLINQ